MQTDIIHYILALIPIAGLFIINAVIKSDNRESLKEILSLLGKEVLESVFIIEETEHQIKTKKWIGKITMIIVNLFFLLILVLSLYSGGKYLYIQWGDPLINLGKEVFQQSSNWWNKTLAVLIALVLFLFLIIGIFFLLVGTLKLFKYASIVDIFKVFILIQLTISSVAYFKADEKGKHIVLAQMVDRIIKTNFEKYLDEYYKSQKGVIKLNADQLKKLGITTEKQNQKTN